MEKFSTAARQLLGSRSFYYVLLAIFIWEASWIALTARYPMAFDENYHFGIIQYYAHQLSPFIRHENSSAYPFGDITRYPSYLFHYLMSFPYRLIARLTSKAADQVVALRFIDIGFFTTGLILWRRVLKTIGVSAALAGGLLAVFILVPQVPFLAGQINYDDLLFPLVALCTLLSAQIFLAWRQGEWRVWQTGWLVAVGCLASLVMYSFLPIFVALVGYLAVQLWRERPTLAARWQSGWQKTGGWGRAILVGALLVSIGLFVERYGYNIIRYHTVVPDCGQILNTQACLHYGPWKRNYDYLNDHLTVPALYKWGYVPYWIYRMFYQLFFVLNPGYATSQMFPLPLWFSVAVSFIGTWWLIRFWRPIKEKYPAVGWLFGVLIVYGAALLLLDFSEYLHFGVPVAIQGRYLIPVLPIIFVLLVWAWQEFWQRKDARLQAVIALVALVLLLQGGGVLTWMAKTNSSYWWPNQTVVKVSRAAQTIVRPLLLNNWNN